MLQTDNPEAAARAEAVKKAKAEEGTNAAKALAEATKAVKAAEDATKAAKAAEDAAKAKAAEDATKAAEDAAAAAGTYLRLLAKLFA